MIKDSTKRKIDKAVAKTLKEAGMREPPFLIEDLLDYLELDREFYDLEDPGLLRRFQHKVRVKGKILSKIKETIKLAALCLPDENGDLHEFYAESFFNRYYVYIPRQTVE